MALRIASAVLALALAFTVFMAATLPLSLRANSTAPDFVDVRTAAKRSSSNPQVITVDVPPGESGDLLIALVALARDRTPEAPAGWTLIDSGIAAEDEARLAIWYRVADGSEGESYAFTWADGRSRGGGAILRYRGVDPASPIGQRLFANWRNRRRANRAKREYDTGRNPPRACVRGVRGLHFRYGGRAGWARGALLRWQPW